MKKLLGMIFLSFLFINNTFAVEDKIFYISCSAKGYQELSYSGTKHAETIIDEYKITIGKGDIIEGDKWPKIIELINTNANKEGFHLLRNYIDDSISYSDRIISFGAKSYFPSKEVYNAVSISLISGTYDIFYKDKIYGDPVDIMKYSAVGNCSGLAPVLSYLENNTKSSTGSSNSTIKKLLKKLY